MSDEILRRLEQAVIVGEAEEAAELTRRGLDQGLSPLLLVDAALTPGMNRIGAGGEGPSFGGLRWRGD
jgi:methanogenic corrinoid protein MtbC1